MSRPRQLLNLSANRVLHCFFQVEIEIVRRFMGILVSQSAASVQRHIAITGGNRTRLASNAMYRYDPSPSQRNRALEFSLPMSPEEVVS
jgi:hypothetical protein